MKRFRVWKFQLNKNRTFTSNRVEGKLPSRIKLREADGGCGEDGGREGQRSDFAVVAAGSGVF